MSPRPRDCIIPSRFLLAIYSSIVKYLPLTVLCFSNHFGLKIVVGPYPDVGSLVGAKSDPKFITMHNTVFH
jgi:hypothetical protein